MQPLFHGLYMDHTIFPTIQHKYNMRYTIDIIPYYTILYHIVPYYTILYHIIPYYHGLYHTIGYTIWLFNIANWKITIL